MAYSDQDFEDELRNKLGNDAPLPPGMDWEAMRRGVKQKVAAKRKARRPILAWWWPGIGVALLLLAGVIGYQLQCVSTIPEQSLPAAEAFPIDQGKSQIRPSVAAADVSSEEFSPVQSATLPEKGTDRQAILPPTSTQRQRKVGQPAQRSIQTSSSEASKDSFESEATRQTIFEASSTSVANDQILRPTALLSGPRAIDMLPFRSHSFVPKSDSIPFPIVKGTIKREIEQEGITHTVEAGPPIPLVLNRWSFDVIAGTQFSSSTYRGDDLEYATLRSRTETALPGHHLALGIGKEIGKKWHLRTGLAYDRFRTRTDFNAMNLFDSTFQNVPLRIDVSGDTIYGAAELAVRETREVRSFQREQRLALPLLIGRDFWIGGGSLAMRMGPEFSLLIGNGGKVLTANETVRLLSDTDFQRLSISARFEAELSVRIGNRERFLIGRIGYRRAFGGKQLEIRKKGNSVFGGIGIMLLR